MNDKEQVTVFVLATLFTVARYTRVGTYTSKEAFDAAEDFLKEAKKRGIDLKNLK